MYNETLSNEMCKHIRFYAVKSPDNKYDFYLWAEKEPNSIDPPYETYWDSCNVRSCIEIINNNLSNKAVYGSINYKCTILECIAKDNISEKYLVHNCGNRTVEFIDLFPLLIKPSLIRIEIDCSGKFYLSMNIDKILDASAFSRSIYSHIKHMIRFNPYKHDMQVQERTKCTKSIVPNQNLLCTKDDKSIEDMHNDIWDIKEVNYMNNKLEIPKKLCKHIRFYIVDSPARSGFYIWADISIDHNMNNTGYFMIRRYVKLINEAIYKDMCTGYLHIEKIKITGNKKYCRNHYLVLADECTDNRIKDNPLLIIPSNIIIEQEGNYHYISIDIDTISEINAKEHESYIISMIGFNPYKNNAILTGKIMKCNEKNKNGMVYPYEIIVDSLPGGSRVNKFGSIDFNIKKVIHNDSATVVFWETGDKTVVKKQKGEDKDDLEKAIMAAYMKKAISRGYNSHERSMEEVLDKVKSDLAKQQQNDKKSKKKKK